MKEKQVGRILGSAAPTWCDSIKALFEEPYWIPAAERSHTAQGWHKCMHFMDFDIQDYNTVKAWSGTIYNHLFSRSMPLTTNPAEYWPDEALELFRLWVNQGSRKTQTDAIDQQERIPAPKKPIEQPLRIRRDITTLTDEELNTYRMKLEDIGIQSASLILLGKS